MILKTHREKSYLTIKMGSKKKKQEKRKDFVKQRLKVGKTAKAANHTDTSFKSKAISLPNQSIGTKSIDHYISLTKHHSSSTRKEVLVLLEKSIPQDPKQRQQLIKAIIPLITDEAKEVREALLALFKALAQTNYKLLEVNSNQLILYIHSAMNHITPLVCNSSVGFLNIIIDNYPDQLIESHFVKTIDGFYNVLNWSKSQKKQVNNKSPKVVLNNLSSLRRFLQTSLIESSSETIKANYGPYTKLFFFPTISNPFSQLNLYNQVDNTSTDLLNRRKIINDTYKESLLFNIRNMIDDNREIASVCRDIQTLVEQEAQDN